MKLSLLTYLLGKDMKLDELLDVVRETGVQGLEFRAEAGHLHGVELERTTRERAAIRRQCETAHVPVVCIATGCKFEYPDEDKRRENIERAMQYVDLAADVGAPRIRVFGNDFPEEIAQAEVVQNVGLALREIGEYGEKRGVDVCLEMHGDFYWWEHALNAVRIAGHPRVGIVHNCDMRELKYGPISSFYDPVKNHIRHVHLHDLESNYPYKSLFRMLKHDGYAGYLSLEASASEDPTRVIAIYVRLFHEWVESA